MTEARSAAGKQPQRRAVALLLILVFLGIAFRLYDLAAPWKTHDHYNFGGVWTTAYAECLKTTPLSVSKGVAHLGCHAGETLAFYRAHSSVPLFMLWAWTSVFGDSEAAHRSLIWLFSTINIALVFLLSSVVFSSRVAVLTAAAAQSVFLGGLYFGTHLDFIGEPTVSFVLVSALLAACGYWRWSILWALLAGLVSWPGYIMLATLSIDALIRRHRADLITAGLGLLLGFAMALGTMMWLHQSSSVFGFLSEKLVSPGYVRPDEAGWLLPLLLAKNVLSSLSRLVGPALFGLVILALLARAVSPRALRVAWLAGGTGALYTIAGAQYHMVHVYLYLFWLPGLAILLGGAVDSNRSLTPSSMTVGWGWYLALVGTFAAAALYPFGIFKSNAVHDAVNSGLFIGTALALLVQVWRSRPLSVNWVIGVLAVTGAGNISQMINYRNESDTERSFCETARALAATLPAGEAVRAHLISADARPTDAKRLLYCRGLKIDFTKTTSAP